jgi:hypothetical protein
MARLERAEGAAKPPILPVMRYLERGVDTCWLGSGRLLALRLCPFVVGCYSMSRRGFPSIYADQVVVSVDSSG